MVHSDVLSLYDFSQKFIIYIADFAPKGSDSKSISGEKDLRYAVMYYQYLRRLIS